MIFPPPQSCKVVIQSDVVGNIVTLVDDIDETWSQLCQRTVEKDYLLSHRRLLPLLVHIHPGKRLVAYRLRYDMGHGTIIKPTWSQQARDHGVIHDRVPVLEAFIDVNVSLRQSRTAPEFEPHETIIASLGAEGCERTTYVNLHCEKIGVDGENGACPFPITRELTRVLFCNEHERFPGCTDGYELFDEVSDEIYDCSLPRTCINTCMAGVDHETIIQKTALTSRNIDEVYGINCFQRRVDKDVEKDICLIENVKRNRTAASDEKNNAQEMSKTDEVSSNQVSVSMVEEVGQDDAAESKIDKQPISREIVVVVEAKKKRTLNKDKSIPFKITKTSSTTNTLLSATGTITLEQSPSDFGGVATDVAEKSHTKTASLNSTGCAAGPSEKNDGHKAMKLTGLQSDIEPSSETTVKAATNIELSLDKKENSNKPAKYTTDGKNQGNEEMPVSSTDETNKPISTEPANGFPPGWTVRRSHRIGSARMDCRYYSPQLDYSFRTKPQAQRFVKYLEEANGNEKEAMELFKQKVKGNTTAVAADGRIDNSVKSTTNAAQTKRQRQTNAAKKTSRDSASGKEDDASTTSLIVELEQPSKKRSNIMRGEIAQEIDFLSKSHNEEGGKPRKKKHTDPTQPKRPPSAYVRYCMNARPKLISEHPTLKPAELQKKLTDAYKSLGQDELKHYQNEAAEAMKQYKKSLAPVAGDMSQQNL